MNSVTGMTDKNNTTPEAVPEMKKAGDAAKKTKKPVKAKKALKAKTVKAKTVTTKKAVAAKKTTSAKKTVKAKQTINRIPMSRWRRPENVYAAFVARGANAKIATMLQG